MGYPWSRKPNPLPTSFTVILDDTLSFIANIFFLILLIEQLNFFFFIHNLFDKITDFLFYSRILNTWRWKENKEHGLLGYIMIFRFMVDIVYVCILT